MNGIDYRATTRLSDRDSVTLALPGQTCERVPVESLPWLLESGHIESVSAPAQVLADILSPDDISEDE